jgi:hypothetical protein
MTRNPQSTTHSEKRPVPSNKSRVRDSDHRFTRQVTEITRTTTQNPHTYTHPPTTTLPPSAASTRFSLTDRLGSPIHQSARTRTHAHTHTRTHAHTHTRARDHPSTSSKLNMTPGKMTLTRRNTAMWIHAQSRMQTVNPSVDQYRVALAKYVPATPAKGKKTGKKANESHESARNHHQARP